MKERPILFSGPMVRALLNGSKTQTRRVVKPQPPNHMGTVRGLGNRDWQFVQDSHTLADSASTWRCPYGQPGDRLWVREAFADLRGTGIEHRPTLSSAIQRYAFAADTKAGSYGDDARKQYGIRWKPSIHMPRAASRITLEITSVRVERLQDISEADAIAEGCAKNHNNYYWGGPHKAGGLKQMATARQAYQDLWESINGPGSWEANPWVWVVGFKRVEGGAA